MQPQNDLLTVEEVARLLRATPRTVRNLIEAGYFPRAFTLNPKAPRSVWRIPRADVDAYLNRPKEAPPSI